MWVRTFYLVCNEGIELHGVVNKLLQIEIESS